MYDHSAINVYRSSGFKIEGKLEMNHWNYIQKEYGDDYMMGLSLENQFLETTHQHKDKPTIVAWGRFELPTFGL